MKFNSKNADIFVPDGTPFEEALKRTTHLCIVAHQDDSEIAAYHGIAECFGQKELWFSSVIVTDGAGSPRAGVYCDYSDEEMKVIRKQEQKKAAFVGEYSVQIQLCYPSAMVKDHAEKGIVEDLKNIIMACHPKIVYLHNPADKHDTHVSAFLRSLEALRAVSDKFIPEKVYGCEVWRDFDWLMDDEKVVLPVSKYKNLSASLLGVFDSQITGGKRYDLAAAGRRLANATFYASHSTDVDDALTYAIDLIPLVKDPSLKVDDFVLSKIDMFKNDVKSRLAKFS